MTWIEFHDTLQRHPKTLAAATALKVSRGMVAGHLGFAWAWAISHKVDGGPMSAEELKMASDWPKSAASWAKALLEAGFIDERDGGFWFHDWDDYAGRMVQRRKANAQRMKESRAQNVQRTDDARASNVQGLPNRTVPEIDHAQARETEHPGAPSLYGALMEAGIQRTPERWVESWLDRGRTPDHIRDAIGRMREKGASNTRYLDAILERETTKPVRSTPQGQNNGGRPSWMPKPDEQRIAQMRVVS